jgi:hypothetical protein
MKNKPVYYKNGQVMDPVFNRETFETIANAKAPPVPTVRKTKKYKQGDPALRAAMESAASERRRRALQFIYG